MLTWICTDLTEGILHFTYACLQHSFLNWSSVSALRYMSSSVTIVVNRFTLHTHFILFIHCDSELIMYGYNDWR